MWSGVSRLLIGIVLIGLAVWVWIYGAHAWDHVWQKERATAAKNKPVVLIDPTFASDPSIAPAKVKVIGPLASAMQQEQDEVNGTDNSASAEPATSGQPTALDHVTHPSSTAPQRFHSTFLVKSYKYYRFLVPVQASSPKLHGRFSAFTTDKNAAAADVLLLDEGQFDDLIHGRPNGAVFASTSSTGIIDVTLSPGILEPKKYYLVFRTPDQRPRLVSADVTASFE